MEGREEENPAVFRVLFLWITEGDVTLGNPVMLAAQCTANTNTGPAHTQVGTRQQTLTPRGLCSCLRALVCKPELARES